MKKIGKSNKIPKIISHIYCNNLSTYKYYTITQSGKVLHWLYFKDPTHTDETQGENDLYQIINFGIMPC